MAPSCAALFLYPDSTLDAVPLINCKSQTLAPLPALRYGFTLQSGHFTERRTLSSESTASCQASSVCRLVPIIHFLELQMVTYPGQPKNLPWRSVHVHAAEVGWSRIR